MDGWMDGGMDGGMDGWNLFVCTSKHHGLDRMVEILVPN